MRHVKRVSVAKADTWEDIGSWIEENSTALIASVVSLLAGAGLGAWLKGEYGTSR